MSIIELLNEIGKLAQIINEKNHELENLRKNYDTKLQMINKYIEELSLSSSSSPSTITEERLIAQLSESIECPNCQYRIWENCKNSDFLLIPKSKIATRSNPGLYDKASTPPTPVEPSTITKPYKKKSNIVCSYCKKTGHTRAKCRTRLITPIPTNNNNS